MSSPYGPPGGYPQWGQQPPGPGMQPGGMPPVYPQPGGYGGQQPFAPQHVPQQPVQQQPVQQPIQQQPIQQPYGYGQPQPYYPSPGGFGFPAVPQKRTRSKLPWVLGGSGVLVVLAVVLVLGFVAPGFFVRPVLDAASVEKGVAQTLKGSYSIAGVGAVTCPDGQPVEVRHSFDCQVHVNGASKVVTVTVKNEEGVYEVGHPK